MLAGDARGALFGMALALAAGAATAAEAEAPEAPPRVVTVGGAITEIVYALGREDWLVAVDTTSTYPTAASDLPRVGYFRELSAEPILAMRPTLLIHETSAGPPEALGKLEAAGVDRLVVPDDPTVEGAIEKVERVAKRLDAVAAGAKLVAEMREAMAELETLIADEAPGAPERPRVLFAMSFEGGSVFAAGRGTAADGVIRLAGGDNVADDFVAYKQIGGEALSVAAPEVIVTPAHTLEAGGGLDRIRGLPAVRATPAGQAGRIVVMDALYLLGFGPRLPEAARELARVLYPPDGGT